MTDPQAMTEAEYLRTERESPFKREYVGGFVYPLHAQAGTSGNHVPSLAPPPLPRQSRGLGLE